jgi:hypothetical protein
MGGCEVQDAERGRGEKEIETYRRKPVKQKLQWLEAQMEFF